MQKNLDELLERIKSGDEDAFGELYSQTSRQVFAYLLTIVDEYHTAEDLTQDTYIKIRKGIGNYRSGNAFAWIMQIAKNTALSDKRKNSRVTPTDFESGYAKERSYTPDFDGIPILEIIRTRFDDVDRRILFMRLSAGYKHKEISDELKIPLGTVLWRYNKAIKNLQKIIKEEYGQ
ncbi:MAG: RNA polymerase sigma factor [Clostridia bacterium]|nr:RNA polymerase sigma factor [Clostridia bacterium]